MSIKENSSLECGSFFENVLARRVYIFLKSLFYANANHA